MNIPNGTSIHLSRVWVLQKCMAEVVGFGNEQSIIDMDNNSILQKLEGLEARFEEISTLITDPNVIGDQQRFV